jgi:hypothetical protein
MNLDKMEGVLMKKMLFLLVLFALPTVVAMESTSSDDESSESTRFDDGRSERWTVGPDQPLSLAKKRTMSSVHAQFKSRQGGKRSPLEKSPVADRARQQRVEALAAQREKQRRSSRLSCFSFLRIRKLY